MYHLWSSAWKLQLWCKSNKNSVVRSL